MNPHTIENWNRADSKHAAWYDQREYSECIDIEREDADHWANEKNQRACSNNKFITKSIT